MNATILRLRRLLVSEDGPAAVEYAVMLALIITVCITVIRTLGANTIGSFGAFSTAMNAPGALPDRRPASRRLDCDQDQTGT